MAADTHPLFVEPRFCGPPGTVNGGFACGAVAARCGGAAEVTLRRPVPVGRPLRVRDGEPSALVVLDGDVLVAEARAAAPVPAPPPAVVAAAVRPVARRARYFDAPAFPGCFVCGPHRAAGDGLRIFPGQVAGSPVWAAPWDLDDTVVGTDGRVRPEVVWAALDCPAGIAAGEAAGLPDGTTALLGRMTADVLARPRPDQADRVVVAAWPVARDGRRLTAGSALLDPDGAVLATARTLWITVPHPATRQTAGATP